MKSNFWATALLVTVRTMLRDRCPACPVCNVGVFWPNGSMDQDTTGTEAGLGPGHIVLDGDSVPPRIEVQQSPLSVHVYCGQTVAHLSNC